eukprot:990419-Pelagomonas_calceolata.AAC.7
MGRESMATAWHLRVYPKGVAQAHWTTRNNCLQHEQACFEHWNLLRHTSTNISQHRHVALKGMEKEDYVGSEEGRA